MTRIERLSIDLPNERRTAVMWRARGWRAVFQLTTVLIAVAGCSGDSNRLASDGTMEDVAQAAPTASPAPQPVQTTLSENVIVPDIFVGMWDYNEEEPFHNAEAQGILLIEGPCVYIIHDHIIYDYPWIPPPSEDPPDPIRIFLELPRDQTSYDPDTETIQVHDQGPMASGDRVVAGGGGVGQSPPDVCPLTRYLQHPTCLQRNASRGCRLNSKPDVSPLVPPIPWPACGTTTQPCPPMLRRLRGSC